MVNGYFYSRKEIDAVIKPNAELESNHVHVFIVKMLVSLHRK